MHITLTEFARARLHVHRNWTSTRCLTVPITSDNQHLLRSGYEAR
jgi:hypothetical protein